MSLKSIQEQTAVLAKQAAEAELPHIEAGLAAINTKGVDTMLAGLQAAKSHIPEDFDSHVQMTNVDTVVTAVRTILENRAKNLRAVVAPPTPENQAGGE